MVSFREFLNEAAKNLENYALKADERLCYLYKNDDELAGALESYDMTDMEDKILFVFGIKEDMGMNVFDAVYAKRGYGPVAYKTAMTLVSTMAPVQDSRITKGAEKVWKEFYNGKGSKEVHIETWGSSEDMMWKRSTYSLKKPLNLSKNIKEHENFIGKDPYGERISMLDELADGVLISKMGELY
jgi:hypothetical protein